MSEDKNVGHPMMAQIMKVVDQSCRMERMILPSIVPKRKPFVSCANPTRR
jgi:hypothetical protein